MTHYDTLGISKHATAQEIKTAYRNLAKQYHPDKTQGNKAFEEKFKQINHAYDILSDPTKKANYDFIIATFNDTRKYNYPPTSSPPPRQTKQRKAYDYSHYNKQSNTSREEYNRKDYNALEWFALKNSNLASCLFMIAIAVVSLGLVIFGISVRKKEIKEVYVETKPSKSSFDSYIATLNNQLINDSLNFHTYIAIGDAYAGDYDKVNYYPNRASIYYELAYSKLCQYYSDSSVIREYTSQLFHKNIRLESNKSKTLELSILKVVESGMFDPQEINYYNAFIAYHSAYYKFCIQYALDYLNYDPSSVRCMMLIIHSQIHLKEYDKAKLNFDEFLNQAKYYLSEKEIYDFDSFFSDINNNKKIDCNTYFESYASPMLSVISGLKSVICYEKDEEEN